MAGDKTITQRIALEGGKEIEVQLRAIGEEGADAFKKLGDGAKAGDTLDKLSPTLDAIRDKAKQIAEVFGDVVEKAKEFGTAAVDVAKNVSAVIGAVTALAVGFSALVLSAAKASDEVTKTAQSIGLTANQFRELSFAFAQGGVEQEQFTKGLTRFARQIDGVLKKEADHQAQVKALSREYETGKIGLIAFNDQMDALKKNATENGDAFSRLGIVVARSNDGNIDMHETLLRAADALKNMKDGVTKTALATELFGKGNARFVAALSGGRAALEAFEKEAKRVAPPISELAQKQATQLTIAFGKLKSSIDSIRQNSLAPFFAPLKIIIDAITETIVRNRAAIISFAESVANNVKPVITDLVALLEGRDNDVKNTWILKVRDSVIGFADAIKSAFTSVVIPTLNAVVKVFDGVAAVGNKVFGTELTGAALLVSVAILRVLGVFRLLGAGISLIGSVAGGLVKIFGGWAKIGAFLSPVVTVVRSIAGFLLSLVTAAGLVTASIAAIGFGIGFFVTKAILQLGGFGVFFQRLWDGAVIIVTTAFNAIGSFIAFVWNGIVAGASAVVNRITGFFVGLGSGVVAAFNSVVSFIARSWEAVKNGAAAVVVFIANGFGTLVQKVKDFFLGLPDALAAAWDSLKRLAVSAWQGILDKASELADALKTKFQAATSAVGTFFQELYDKVRPQLETLIAKVKEFVASLPSAGVTGTGSDTAGFAGGGHVRGPGTGTSDSILARLSDNEYVIRAKAVKHWGVGFLNRLNSLREPLRGAAARFREGGLVDFGSILPTPRFADGGLVNAATGGVNTMHLHLPNGDTAIVSGGNNAMASLARYAERKNVRSTGRKPAWFEG